MRYVSAWQLIDFLEKETKDKDMPILISIRRDDRMYNIIGRTVCMDRATEDYVIRIDIEERKLL